MEARVTSAEDRPAADALPGQVRHNIRAITVLHEREQQKLGESQRMFERLGAHMARPYYLLTILCLVIAWIGGNELLRWTGRTAFDGPPYVLLQGVITLTALLTTGIVLSAQARAARIEKQRAHLDLQVNLVTEQKVTKIIELLEELRRDLPMVKDRHDPVAAELQRHTNPHLVLSAIEESGATGEKGPGGAGG
jgi:uncharacterized membrane protein